MSSQSDTGLCTFSAFPLSPTKVPLLVYSVWEADREADRSEYGAPRTSKRASVADQRIFMAPVILLYSPGPSTSRLVAFTGRLSGCALLPGNVDI